MLKYPFNREFVVTSGFGPRAHPVTGIQGFHSGTDYAAPTGTTVLSPLTGIVLFTGADERSGKYMAVAGEGFTVSFSHLSAISAQKGEPVATGQPIALTGETGAATGPHAHVRVKNATGEDVDPETVFTQESGSGFILAAAAIVAAL